MVSFLTSEHQGEFRGRIPRTVYLIPLWLVEPVSARATALLGLWPRLFAPRMAPEALLPRLDERIGAARTPGAAVGPEQIADMLAMGDKGGKAPRVEWRWVQGAA